MSVLKTFQILFTSNSKDVVKGNDEVEKSTKKTEDALRRSNEQADKLGQSFVKMVEGAATVAGAYVGFSALKSGVQQAIDYNTQLKNIASQSGQTAQGLKTMAQFATQFGDSKESALGDIQAISSLQRKSGLANTPIEDFYLRMRKELQGIPTDIGKNNRLDAYGIHGMGLRRALKDTSDEEYNQQFLLSKQRSLYQDLSDFDRSTEKFKGTMESYYTKIGMEVMPISMKVLDEFSYAFGAITDGYKPYVLGIGHQKILGVNVPVPTLTRAGGSGSVDTPSGIRDDLLDHLIKPKRATIAEIKGITNKSPQDEMGFWMEQGYSQAQAAAIVANRKHESGDNPHAIGDSGTSIGMFQWKADRRKAIFDATKIDVSTASPEDQLKAAAWEMKNGRKGFDDSYFRTIKDADKAAAYFSNKFESPRDLVGQALSRGKTALSITSQYQPIAGGNTNSVTIGKIEINTAATDADGISKEIEAATMRSLAHLQSQYDDGRAK